MNVRSETVFYRTIGFTDALSEFDSPVVAAVNAHIQHFERAWKASKHDGDIPKGFDLEFDKEAKGPYRLYQVRVGPKHGYRADVVFLDNGSDAYWVYTFKKVRDRQPEDMKRARIQAQRLWEELQGGNHHGTR